MTNGNYLQNGLEVVNVIFDQNFKIDFSCITFSNISYQTE